MKIKIKTFMGRLGSVDEKVNEFMEGKEVVDVKQATYGDRGNIFLSNLVIYKEKQ